MARTNNSSRLKKILDWINGEYVAFNLDDSIEHHITMKDDKAENYLFLSGRKKRDIQRDIDSNAALIRLYRRLYPTFSIIFCLIFIGAMLITVSYLPRFGEADTAHNNEVSGRYIEDGLEETGAVNIVAGMILDYRAFDTFGESCVLFAAICCVFILLRIDSREKDLPSGAGSDFVYDDQSFEPNNDLIMQRVVKFVSPIIILFGFYIVLNGHLSAGGGFAGGAVMGAGMILYLLAFGFERTERFINLKVFRAVTCSALLFYCLAKGYSFYTGANGMETGIPLGIPGNILSSGLILPLNICVGLVVSFTMYGFYVTFRKGGF